MILAVIEKFSYINKSKNVCNDKNDNRQHKIKHFAVGIEFNLFAFVGGYTCCKQITFFFCIDFMNTHGTVIELHKSYCNYKYESKKRVEVEGNCSHKQFNTGIMITQSFNIFNTA